MSPNLVYPTSPAMMITGTQRQRRVHLETPKVIWRERQAREKNQSDAEENATLDKERKRWARKYVGCDTTWK